MRQLPTPWQGLAALLLLSGCDDFLFGEVGVEDEDVPEVQGLAGVQEIVNRDCLGCHDAANQLGGLDLETDLYAATVNVLGQYQIPLVFPGEPDDSMLYLKMSNTHPDGTGNDMPPGSGGLSAALTGVVRQWIVEGAPDASGQPADTGLEE